MKLTLEDVMGKELIVVSDVDMDDFAEGTLDYIKSITSNELKTVCDIENALNYLFSEITEMTKDVDEFISLYFVCKPSEGTFLWNLILDNDIIMLDSYVIDIKKQEMSKYLGFEIYSTDENKYTSAFENGERYEYIPFAVTLKSGKEYSAVIETTYLTDEEYENLDIQLTKLSELIRLKYYISMIICQDN